MNLFVFSLWYSPDLVVELGVTADADDLIRHIETADGDGDGWWYAEDLVSFGYAERLTWRSRAVVYHLLCDRCREVAVIVPLEAIDASWPRLHRPGAGEGS